MLTIGKVTYGSLGSYYAQEEGQGVLSSSNSRPLGYYSKDGGKGPTVAGSGVKMFGVENFTMEKFETLTEQSRAGQDGDNQKKIVARDLTFSAPKSVSIVHAFGNEDQKKTIEDAQMIAVQRTLKHLEESGLFRARKKENGRVTSPLAEGMTSTIFIHATSRNLDPDLHCHALIANIAKIPGEQQIRSADYYMILQNSRKLGAFYRNELARELFKNGFDVEITDQKKCFFEIQGISRDVIDEFSSRRKEILAKMKSWGIDSDNSKAAQSAAYNTRNKKNIVPSEILKKTWEKQAEKIGFDPTSVVQNHSRQEPNPKSQDQKIKVLVGDAVKKLEDQIGVYKIGDIVFEAVQDSLRQKSFVSGDLIKSEVEKNYLNYGVVKIPRQWEKSISQSYITTSSLVKKEKNLVETVSNGKENQLRLVKCVNQKIAEYNNRLKESQGWSLNNEQVSVVKEILAGTDRVIGIQGFAGTGKTSSMRAVNELFDSEKIQGLALQGVAAKNLENGSGIKSNTIHSFVGRVKEKDQETISRIKNGIIIVDEAGMVNSHLMSSVFKIANRYSSKIVLAGDTSQLVPVGAGKPFHMLQERGMKTLTMKDIRRQNDPELRAVVKTFAQRKEIREAVQKLDSKNLISEIRSKRNRFEDITSNFVSEIKDGKNSLVVTSLNKDKDAMNRQIRCKLKNEGMIEKSGIKIDCEQIRGDECLKKTREFCVGDKILFTKNNTRMGVQNGTVAIIDSVGVNKLDVVLDTGSKLSVNILKYKNLDYGYAVTSYKSQGKTVLNVHFDANTKSPMLSRNETYVGISRCKNSVQVYTDDKEKFVKRVKDFQKKRCALDSWEKKTSQNMSQSQPKEQTRDHGKSETQQNSQTQGQGMAFSV